jgi:Glycosyl transferase family 2
MMTEQLPGRAEPLVSIIVNNFNYGRFLPYAIDSALNQDYPHTEVIVVDDGSTDDSLEVIAGYGSRIKPVLKSNGGQASALNAGFAVSRGDVIFFLDADDILLPQAVTRVVPRLMVEGVSKVHWPMWLIDAHGEKMGGTRPSEVPPEGDFRAQVLERGPLNVASSPTSGNAWSRTLLEHILPIPEAMPYYRSCADEYLYNLAPVFGYVRTLVEPQGCYRLHGNNVYSSRSFLEKLELELNGYEQQCVALENALAKNKILVDASMWKQHSWFHRLDRALTHILARIPEGAELVLIDGDTWGIGREFEGRLIRPFNERSGLDWGPPTDDAMASRILDSSSMERVNYLVLSWSCFWWQEEYPEWFRHLEQVAQRIVCNSDLCIFEFHD